MSIRLKVCTIVLLLLPAFSYAETTLKWIGCGITKHAFMKELSVAYEAKTGVKIAIEGGGATRGIHEAHNMQTDADMGGTCRFLTAEEHDTIHGVQFLPIAWDALVIIVHKNNPVENMTMAQLRALYRGEITNWKQLGGPDRPLKLFIRKGKTSGVGATLRKLVFHNPKVEFVSPHVFKSSGPLEQALEKDEDAIAVTGISSARRRNLKILNLEGKNPSYAAIKDGEYILYRPLYLAVNIRKPHYDDVMTFIEFARSEEGKAIIRKSGCVPYHDGYKLITTYLQQMRSANRAIYNLTPAR
jgi:phosphate transport system substrate-binding protein